MCFVMFKEKKELVYGGRYFHLQSSIVDMRVLFIKLKYYELQEK